MQYTLQRMQWFNRFVYDIVGIRHSHVSIAVFVTILSPAICTFVDVSCFYCFRRFSIINMHVIIVYNIIYTICNNLYVTNARPLLYRYKEMCLPRAYRSGVLCVGIYLYTPVVAGSGGRTTTSVSEINDVVSERWQREKLLRDRIRARRQRQIQMF